jgi:hypothetical protein
LAASMAGVAFTEVAVSTEAVADNSVQLHKRD